MADANGPVKDALRYLDQHFDEFKATLVALSKIPSISADGFPPEEVRRSAEATADYLERRPQPVPPRMPAMATESADLASFEGVVWRATRFGPALATIPPDESEFSLEVQGDRLAGRSGCNRYMGTWSVVDGRIQIGPLASTMMYCDGLMELERTFLDAIQSVTAASEEGDHLVLRAGGDPVAEFARTEPKA